MKKNILTLTFISITALALSGCGDNKIAVTKKEEQMINRICKIPEKTPQAEVYLNQGFGKKLTGTKECIEDFKKLLMSATGSDEAQLLKRKDLLNSVFSITRNMDFARVDNHTIEIPETKLFSSYLK